MSDILCSQLLCNNKSIPQEAIIRVQALFYTYMKHILQTCWPSSNSTQNFYSFIYLFIVMSCLGISKSFFSTLECSNFHKNLRRTFIALSFLTPLLSSRIHYPVCLQSKSFYRGLEQVTKWISVFTFKIKLLNTPPTPPPFYLHTTIFFPSSWELLIRFWVLVNFVLMRKCSFMQTWCVLLYYLRNFKCFFIYYL